MRSLIVIFVFASLVSFAQETTHKQLIPYRKGNLWGYADEKKNIVIAPKFEKASFFRDEDNLYYAEGQLDGKKIIIQEDGTHVADEFSSDDGGFMSLGDMYIEWYREEKDDPSLSSKGKNGFELKNGVFRKAPVYERAYDFVNKDQAAVLVLKDSKKHGVATSKGDIMIPFEYDNINCINRKDLIFAAAKDGKWIIIDSKNVRIGTTEFTQIGEPSYDRVLVRNGAGFGFIDTKGKLIVPMKYSEASGFGDDPASGKYAWVSDRGFEFFIDLDGVEFVER